MSVMFLAPILVFYSIQHVLISRISKNCSLKKVSVGTDVTMTLVLTSLKEPHEEVGGRDGGDVSHKTFTMSLRFVSHVKAIFLFYIVN